MRNKNINYIVIGVIVKSSKDKIITSLVRDENNELYIMDLIHGTDFKEYYFYKVLKSNIAKFLNDKDKTALSPESKIIYRIHTFDNRIIGIENINNTTLFANELDTEWECEDYNKIYSYINNL
jgi:hypothetical protein